MKREQIVLLVTPLSFLIFPPKGNILLEIKGCNKKSHIKKGVLTLILLQVFRKLTFSSN